MQKNYVPKKKINPLFDYSKPDCKRWILLLKPKRKNVEDLINALQNDPNAIVRHEAAFLMGESKNKNAIK